MNFFKLVLIGVFLNANAAHAYNIAYWEGKVTQSNGKTRVEHVVLNESGKVWFETLYEGDFASRKSGYFDDLGMTKAAELKVQARTIQLTQFNEPEASRTNSPMTTMIGIENSSECSTNEPFKVVQGRGLGPIFAICDQGRFYLEEIPAAQTIYSLMKTLFQEAQSKGLVGKDI